eukprot:GHVR01076048.1.p1 GENE.GHVR01076048.1~~GHVR01076048.1.p1  ORF type:complete len:134 (-),score=25.49 GHVR01076048.1:148-549(-)
MLTPDSSGEVMVADRPQSTHHTTPLTTLIPNSDTQSHETPYSLPRSSDENSRTHSHSMRTIHTYPNSTIHNSPTHHLHIHTLRQNEYFHILNEVAPTHTHAHAISQTQPCPLTPPLSPHIYYYLNIIQIIAPD